MRRGIGNIEMTFLLGVSVVAFQDPSLEKAREYFELARVERDTAKQIELLKMSLGAKETFLGHFALGELMLSEWKDYGGARLHYTRALALADSVRARARATYKLGCTFESLGDPMQAVLLMKKSLSFEADASVKEHVKQIELAQSEQLISSDQIVKALTDISRGNFGFVAEEASIDLRVQFEFDRADLNGRGTAQAAELGKALTLFDGSRFLLIGHTDSQGEASYNRELSLRRAQAVKSYLSAHYGISKSRIEVEGRGESDLLYPGDSESDHALNRRVEVKLLQ